MTLSMNVVVLLYLVASVFFIQALKGLSHPTTSRRGNAFGMVGMAIAMVTTVALIYKLAPQIATIGIGWVLAGLVVGGTAGTIIAIKVQMTKMPEMVAFMHSMIGLAAVFIAIAAVAEPLAFGITEAGGSIPVGNRIELFIGAFVGAITFSGSVIAFGKLSGKYKFRLFQGAPVVFSGQHLIELGAWNRNARVRRVVLGHSSVVAVLGDARDRVRARRADHHSDRRRRHAGRGVDAEQLLRLGRRGHWFLIEQLHADRRRITGGIERRDSLVHHVQGDESLVLQCDPRRLRRRSGCGIRQRPNSDRCARVHPTTRRSCWTTPRP